VEHKLKIDSLQMILGRYWYVECSCGWLPRTVHPETDRYGRPSQAVALAEGMVHQYEEGCR